MSVFTYSEARKRLARVLDLARKEEVLIKRHGGETFSLTRRSPRQSPFGVPGVKTRATTKDILEAAAESRSKEARLLAETCMTKLRPQAEDTHKLVKCFCEHVFWLKQVHDIVCELFKDDGTQPLMERTAHAFFRDVNDIVIEYFLLEVAKLTDPATSGKRENLTVANLIETVGWPSDCLRDIEQINTKVQSFREYIKPARNRILVHRDKRTAMDGERLGAFPDGKDEELLGVLEQMCDLVHTAAFGVVFGDMSPRCSGDVRDFKKMLHKAIAFERLLSDSSGDDRARLHRLLYDVMSSPGVNAKSNPKRS